MTPFIKTISIGSKEWLKEPCDNQSGIKMFTRIQTIEKLTRGIRYLQSYMRVTKTRGSASFKWYKDIKFSR